MISQTYDDAVYFIKEIQKLDRDLEHDVEDDSIPGYEFGKYSADVADWKMQIHLLIHGIDVNARWEIPDIGDAERARFLSALPAAIDLARELGFGDECVDQMTEFIELDK